MLPSSLLRTDAIWKHAYNPKLQSSTKYDTMLSSTFSPPPWQITVHNAGEGNHNGICDIWTINPLTEPVPQTESVLRYQVQQKCNTLKLFAVFSATAWNFTVKLYTFIWLSYVHLTAKQHLIIFIHDKVTDILAWKTFVPKHSQTASLKQHSEQFVRRLTVTLGAWIVNHQLLHISSVAMWSF